jgi:tetratricopeptide (TPR) repeat protein
MKQRVFRSLAPWMLLLLATGCSVSPYQTRQAPVDDRTSRNEAPAPEPRYERYPEYEPDPAVVSPLPDEPITPSPEPATSVAPAPAPAQTQQSPAVLALLDDAEQARASGDYRAAQGSLQRAQRIAPRDPAVYYSLAQTHMEQEDYNLAEQVALKGVSVAQGNPYQSQRLWQLLAKIRLRTGDPEGSRAAAEKAASF